MAYKYWLKFHVDFFNQREIKKLRRLAGGDTLTIIYLKLQLLSIKTEGYLHFEGTEETFHDQLSLEIDEDVENVKMTLSFLESNKLMEVVNDEYFLPEASKCIGSESESADRVRKFRERRALQCNGAVTIGNGAVTIGNGAVTIGNGAVTICNTDIEEETNNKITDKKEYTAFCKNQDIFDFWNSKQIIIHRTLNDSIRKELEKLTEKQAEELKVAIERYSKALKNKSYFYKAVFALDDFIRQKNGYTTWLDEGKNWASYNEKFREPVKVNRTKPVIQTVEIF